MFVTAAVSIFAAVVAVYSLLQQRKEAQLVVNTHFLNDKIKMLVQHPELIELHGIDRAELAEHGLSEVELAYILNSVFAGQAFHAAGQVRRVQLSPYRVAMLETAKFEVAWIHFIRGRLTMHTPYTAAIDRFYAQRKK
ncbi:MAG: hypothetical protein RIC14_00560 [Filomicrobium sp.]